MERRKDILITLFGDMIALIVVWHLFYIVRFELDWLEGAELVAPATVFLPSLVMALFWICIFAFFGLYKRLYLVSRFDEIIRVGKISIIGTLLFFFLLFTDDLNWNADNISSAKNYTFVYWLLTFSLVSAIRLIIRTMQRMSVKRGFGLHRAVIVGVGETARQIYDDIRRHRTTGLDVRGFVNQKSDDAAHVPKIEPGMILGQLEDLNRIIGEHHIEDVIVAVEPEDRMKLVSVLDNIEKPNVSVKIVPDFYQIISGLNQTNQIFGLPLIEVMPDPMPNWEKAVKRIMDIVLSSLILLLSLPVMLLVGLLIRLSSKGPAVFAQERIGLHGQPFVMYKFRSMYVDAEEKTGPTWARGNDPRITPLGLWLRKLRLDELPQLLNVLKGDMSLVGPRPERAYFVNQFKKQIPLYSRRLRVRPGITGWAQVKWKYDETFDDVVEKTKYDLFYVENISLKMDLKILINTLFTMLAGKGQ
ncbi:MAG: undecaprenyl-phosphate glucose phosphotransferase [Cyclonatronaceae bacterium]